MNKLVALGLVASLLFACSSSSPDAAPGACPVAQTSTQTVTFHLKAGASGSFLVTQGSYCEPFSIAQGGTKLGLSLPFNCFCECAGLQRSAVVAGTTGDTTLTWDATSMTYCDEVKDCQGIGGSPPGRTSTYRHAIPIRAKSGHYVATFRLESAPPTQCTAGPDPKTFLCSTMGNPPLIPPSGGEVCPASKTVDVAFDLPASGNADVDVQLP